MAEPKFSHVVSGGTYKETETSSVAANETLMIVVEFGVKTAISAQFAF